MSLGNAHEGYEYQDLITAYFILSEILSENDSTFLIDRKEYKDDKLDDLTIVNPNGIFKKQFKYSNPSVNKKIKKVDLSANSTYQLAIDLLFESWLKHPTRNASEFRLCLAWDTPTDELKELLLLSTAKLSFDEPITDAYQLDGAKLWKEGEAPLKSWKRLRQKHTSINRDLFIEFCSQLVIEINFPKFSLDVYSPGNLEYIVLGRIRSLGIGQYPNERLRPEEFLLAMTAMIRRVRSIGGSLTVKEIFFQLKISTDFGSIEQDFPINANEFLKQKTRVDDFVKELFQNGKISLTGEPGSGKSWFIQNLKNTLKRRKIKVIRHYCYTDLDDPLAKERITVNVFYGNLIADIVKAFPELKQYKQERFASNLSELNILLKRISEPTVLILDGLDHIGRVYSFYRDLTLDQTDIVNKINLLELNDNVKVVLASQPISELNSLIDFKFQSIPAWELDEVEELLKIVKVDNIELEGQRVLSDFLLEKSNGNPLYLKYLITETKRLKSVNTEALNQIPNYSYNLSEYYSYILSKLNTNEQVPRIFAGISFSLTRTELIEISGEGRNIDPILECLSPLLKLNYSQNGYSLYHESFRRFVLEDLKAKGISLKQVVGLPIISWFETKRFHSHQKSYRYYLQFLYDYDEFDKALAFCTYSFLHDSIFYGQSWKSIVNNYNYLLKCATEKQSLRFVILLNEINKTLGGVEAYFEEQYALYFEALGHLHGFNNVAEFLNYEGQPTLSLELGIVGCYLCDKNQTVAPWNLYEEAFKPGENISKENFRYYLRLLLWRKEDKEIFRIAKSISSQKISFHYRFAAHDELNEYYDSDYISHLSKTNSPVKDVLEKKYKYSSKNLDFYIKEFIKIKQNLTPDFFLEFFHKISININDEKAIQQIIGQLEGRNWFHNWVIYCIKIIKLENASTSNFEQVKEAFSYLKRDVDPFKGEPRASDLYTIKDLISDWISKGLVFLNSEEEWSLLLDWLIEISDSLSTSYRKSLMGPFATDKLVEVLCANCNSVNSNLIFEKLQTTIRDKEEYQLHTYISEYCFRISTLASKWNKFEVSEKYFKLGIQYLFGYTGRKDLSLEDLIESIESLAMIDNSLAQTYIKKLKGLVDSVVEHTDGKSTQLFPLDWYKKYLSVNFENACRYLLVELTNSRVDWRLEDCLEQLLLVTGGKYSPIAESFISFTLNADLSEDYLQSRLKMYRSLTDKDKLLANQLAGYILKNAYLKDSNNGFTNEFKEEILSTFQNSVNVEESRIPVRKSYERDRYTFYDWQKTIVSRKEFSEMNSSELLDFLVSNKLKQSDLVSLWFYFRENSELTQINKQVIKVIVQETNRIGNEINTDQVFEGNNHTTVYYLICKFIYRYDGWFRHLTETEALTRAYAIAPELTIQTVFNLLGDIMKLGYSRCLSGNLFNAFANIGYNREELIESWVSMYDSLDYRLPSQEKYDWSIVENDLADYSVSELLESILICRAKANTTFRFHVSLAGVAALNHSNEGNLIKAFKWLLKSNDSFKTTIVISFLLLIRENRFGAQLQQELLKIYPSGYFLLDVIIENFLGLAPREIIHRTPLLEYSIRDDAYDFLLSLNSKFRVLENMGVEMRDVFAKHLTVFRDKYGEVMNSYYNRVKERMIDNIYPFDHIHSILNSDFYSQLQNIYAFIDDELLEALQIDVKAIVGQFNSNAFRPRELNLPSTKNGTFVNPVSSDCDWIRIGHYEKELKKIDTFKYELYEAYGALIYSQQINSKWPFSTSIFYPNDIWNPKFLGEVEPRVVNALIQEDKIEHFKLLWINPTLLEIMQLSVSDGSSGIYAINQENEVVLKFETWTGENIGNGHNIGFLDEIPTLDGAQLLIRKDYFEILSRLFAEKPNYFGWNIKRGK